jgi:hypothetical protein
MPLDEDLEGCLVALAEEALQELAVGEPGPRAGGTAVQVPEQGTE